MKTILVSPSNIIISIKCPYCNASGTIKKETILKKNFLVRCPKCHERFQLKSNNRKYYRKKVSMPVYYSLHDMKNAFDSNVKRGIILNISKSGLLFETTLNKYSLHEDCERKGNILYCLFSFSLNKDYTKIQGKIMNVVTQPKSNQIKVGVRFKALDEYQKQKLGFFLMA